MKFSDLKVLPFIFPSYEEQKEIADYLDQKNDQIEKIIGTINLKIHKLQDLRKSLINDIVTGKIKVVE